MSKCMCDLKYEGCGRYGERGVKRKRDAPKMQALAALKQWRSHQVILFCEQWPLGEQRWRGFAWEMRIQREKAPFQPQIRRRHQTGCTVQISFEIKNNNSNSAPVFANGKKCGGDAFVTHGKAHDLAHSRLKRLKRDRRVFFFGIRAKISHESRNVIIRHIQFKSATNIE